MGTVYKRKRSKFLWIQYCKDGKVYRESAKSTDYDYARRLLKVKEGRLAEGRSPEINASKTRIDQLVDLYLESYKTNGYRSIERAEEFADLIRQHFGHLRAVELTTEHMRQYREKRKAQKVKDSTINRELSSLKRMYRLGMEQDPPLVYRVPKIPFARENNIRKGFFEYKDFEKIRNAAAPHLKVAITIAYYTGMRVGEILGLRWDQVDLKDGILRLETGTTKNSEGREVPLVPDLRQILEWWWLETKNTYPWCQWIVHWKGQRIQKIRIAWKKAFGRAKYEDNVFHDFRRTGVRNLVRAGVSQPVAMAISGHKTDSVFRRYDIVSHQDIVQAGEKLTRYIQEAKTNTQRIGPQADTPADTALAQGLEK